MGRVPISHRVYLTTVMSPFLSGFVVVRQRYSLASVSPLTELCSCLVNAEDRDYNDWLSAHALNRGKGSVRDGGRMRVSMSETGETSSLREKSAPSTRTLSKERENGLRHQAQSVKEKQSNSCCHLHYSSYLSLTHTRLSLLSLDQICKTKLLQLSVMLLKNSSVLRSWPNLVTTLPWTLEPPSIHVT